MSDAVRTALAYVKKYMECYERWVKQNPQQATSLESTLKLASYFFGGKVSSSYGSVFSELVFCTSNLLTFFHDQILKNQASLLPSDPCCRLKVWFSVLEYSEAFLETLSGTLWGVRGKWVAISLIQTIKTVTRFTFLFHYKTGLLVRHHLYSTPKETSHKQNGAAQNGTASVMHTKSGRIIRKIDCATPVRGRTWKLPTVIEEDLPTGDGSLSSRQLAAEVVHALRPMLHLASLAVYGTQSWKPWLISLGLDVTSLQLHGYQKNKHWSIDERRELNNRFLSLLFYLLRSPFYERHSAERLQIVLHALANNVPLVGLVCRPIAHGLPLWQQMYAYMWSN